MKKYITILKDPSWKVQSGVTKFLNPNAVYLPIDENVILLFQKKKVYKGDLLYEYAGKTYFSPVSGSVENIVHRKDQMYLKIKNNFHEDDHFKGENTTILVINDLKKKIKDYYKDAFIHKKEIILNGMEDEPYLANTTFLHKFYAREILLLLDAIANTYEIPSIRIFLKETDRESIESFESVLNTYPNISLSILPDYYLLGKSFILKEYAQLDEKSLLLKTEDVFLAYYDIVKLRKRDFLFVTMTGDALQNPQVVQVKIGTPLNDVMNECLNLQGDYTIFVNGLMMGKEITEPIILTDDVRAVYFMKKRKFIEKECIGCGKCNEVCPVHCDPYQSVVYHKECKNCISCGLCTYICPSHIFISNYLKGGK